MFNYELFYFNYLKSGLKKFGLDYPLLIQIATDAENKARYNTLITIEKLLAGDKHSVPLLLRMQSNESLAMDLINKNLSRLLSLPTPSNGNSRLNKQICMLIYAANLRFLRLDSSTVNRIKLVCNDKKVLELLEENQDTDSKIKNAKEHFDNGRYLNSYFYYKFSGKLDSKILKSIINKLIKNKTCAGLAYVLSNEAINIPKKDLEKLGDFAAMNDDKSSFFYFYQLDCREKFESAIRKIFYFMFENEK